MEFRPTPVWPGRFPGQVRLLGGLDVDHHPAQSGHPLAKVLLQLLSQVVRRGDRQGGIERAVEGDLELAPGQLDLDVVGR